MESVRVPLLKIFPKLKGFKMQKYSWESSANAKAAHPATLFVHIDSTENFESAKIWLIRFRLKKVLKFVKCLRCP